MTNNELIKLAQAVDTRSGYYYMTGNTIYSDRQVVDLLKDFANGDTLHGEPSAALKGKSFRELMNFVNEHFGGIVSKGQMQQFYALIAGYLQALPISNTAQ
jgi:hypothetical protein